ncbi:hypothetical protein E3P89_00969 [Wallemia ichthyophaga]|uniref:AA9 family lytic polysaccharide monooxygenase n=1 Tax=Wallemia ichthyophaga TaxID=245174 RepID=A0A4T0I9P4_WALIC|nr:hypothetical protein E3P90_01264 [Wallemia ichthyophaga]TIB16196.1 hypothetical protein E3P93_01015 [Wallemia ichthyophaga]TIB24423.1 hypothetical protein E3P89_00969 [Wallemia ichthyophaga]TIB26190.1 hypothetical protein E3P88_01133 [Wallemia ichthyophaga]
MAVPNTPDKKPLNDLLARVQALDSANKESSKRKREERDDKVNKRVNGLDVELGEESERIAHEGDNRDIQIYHAAPPNSAHPAHSSVFRATPAKSGQAGQSKTPPNNHKTHTHTARTTPKTTLPKEDDDVIVIDNLTPKKQYTPNSATSNKFRGGRISEAYKMTPRRKMTREMLMPEESFEKENENEDAWGASVQHQDHPVAIDAGTQLQMQWSDDWKHSIGPIMTYLAACVDNDCAQSDVTTLEWFKIDQKAADASGAWWQSELDTQRIYVPIPAALREGNYIVRHEVIVLDQDPVLFFPACAALNVRNQNQVEVEGVETYPSSNFTVEIPGAYGEDDEGLQSVDEAFDAHSYVFPGPPVWQPDVDGLVESASSDGFYEAAEMDVEMAGDAYQVQFLAPNITSSVEFVSSTATTLMPTMTVESVSSTTSSTSTGTATATPSPTPYHAQLSPLPTDINHGESGGEAEDGPSYDDGSWNPTKITAMSIPSVSRAEIVQWINGVLDSNYTKVEQCGTGAIYCQLLDSIYQNVPLGRVKFNARQEYEYINNFKILQTAFRSNKTQKQGELILSKSIPLTPPIQPIPVTALVKCKMQDNLEFCQWFKKFWDEHFPGGEYDAVGRRSGAPGAAVSATPSSGGPTPRTSSAAGTRRPAKLSGGGLSSAAADAQIESLNAQMGDLKINFDSLEKERDFYFAKLRDIEILVQTHLENPETIDTPASEAFQQIQQILYSTEEGFEVPEGEEEDETF